MAIQLEWKYDSEFPRWEARVNDFIGILYGIWVTEEGNFEWRAENGAGRDTCTSFEGAKTACQKDWDDTVAGWYNSH